MQATQNLNPKGIKTLDITAKEWFDRVNGNSYFSARVVIDYALPTQRTVLLPFRYGYGDRYVDCAMNELDKLGEISLYKHLNGYTVSSWQWSNETGVIIRKHKYSKCLKRDVVAYAAD